MSRFGTICWSIGLSTLISTSFTIGTVHYIGDKHHDVFKHFYDKHKKSNHIKSRNDSHFDKSIKEKYITEKSEPPHLNP